MFLSTGYIIEQNTIRLGVSLCFAIFLHIVVIYIIFQAQSQKTLSTELLNMPTNIKVRLFTAQKPIEVEAVKVKKTNTVAKNIVTEKTAKNKPKKSQQTDPKPVKKQISKVNLAKVKQVQKKPETLNKIEPAAPSSKTYQLVSQPVQDVIPVVSEARLKGRRVQPKYPKRALKMRQEGVVLLHVLISKTGSRQDIRIYKPSQYELLNKAAIKAVKKWTFSPNFVNGRAVQSWVEIPIEFKIQ